MPIGFPEDAEDLEPSNDVLHRQPDPGEVAVADSLVVGERVVLAGLLRGPGVGMVVLNNLTAGSSVSGWIGVFDSRGSRRSCVAPRPGVTQRICGVTGRIRSCNFRVWRFLFPLYQSRCCLRQNGTRMGPARFFGAFARCLAHVHDNACQHRTGIPHALLAREGMVSALQQRGLVHFPRLTQVNKRPVFPPEFQRQQQLRPTGNAGRRPDLRLLASRLCSTASSAASVSGSTPVCRRTSAPFSPRACSSFDAVILSSLPPYFCRRSTVPTG
jgi:hypothetical protein